MVRQLVVPVFLAVVLVPDWATAFDYHNPCVSRPVVFVSPGYCLPVVVGPTACCPLAAPPVVAPSTPTVIPERMQEQPKTDPKKSGTQAEPPAREFARPVAAEATPEAKPTIQPASVTEKIPPISVPMPSTVKVLDPPVKPEGGLPKFDIPQPDAPKPPSTMPSLDVPMPKADTLKADDKPKTSAGLPAFEMTFPKADAVAQPVEANKPSVSRSSPVSAERAAVDVYPVAGDAPPGTKTRTVGFINKSDRDVLLTVNGKMVTLPSRNVLRSELPVSFKWQIGGETERDLIVPATAPGVDVVIRK